MKQLVPLIVAACFAGLSSVDTRATVLVDWGGNYVSAAEVPMLPTGTTGTSTAGTTRTSFYGYQAATPASGYDAPSGKSSAFVSAAYLVATHSITPPNTAAGTFSARRVLNNASTDLLDFYRSSRADVDSYQGAAFFGFLKPDFLNGGNSQTITLDADSSLNATLSIVTNAVYHFAIYSDGDWYISQASQASQNTTFSLSGLSLINSSWGLWNVGTSTTIMSNPASVTAFDYGIGDFENIEGFGMVASFAAGSGQNMRWQISSFSVNAVPEPGSAALLILGGFVLVGLRRRGGVR